MSWTGDIAERVLEALCPKHVLGAPLRRHFGPGRLAYGFARDER